MIYFIFISICVGHQYFVIAIIIMVNNFSINIFKALAGNKVAEKINQLRTITDLII